MLAQLRDAFHEYKFAKNQVDELRAMYDEDPADVPGHPAAPEALRWYTQMEDHAARVEDVLAHIRETGADVKDPTMGLVDFFHRRSDGEVVLLCYRDDEEDLLFWHPLDTGFAGRRPLAEL